jgi:hypothetical protein
MFWDLIQSMLQGWLSVGVENWVRRVVAGFGLTTTRRLSANP